MATTTGFLTIADISGYTTFMTESELEHAQDILNGLFDVLLAELKTPFQLSNFQGDAVLSYAPDTAYLSGQVVLEVIEKTYCAFMNRREQMRINTTCTCNACRNIPGLDLKVLMHHGEFVVQQRRGRDELSGKDVILIHRLLKNTVMEDTGIEAYALITQEAMETLDVDPFFDDMPRYEQEIEQIGEVSGAVYDLTQVWKQEREMQRIVVEPDEEEFSVEVDIPLPVMVTWDYLNNPEVLKDLTSSDRFDVSDRQGGRQGPGTKLHCYHGDNPIMMTIMDWRPADYVTFEAQGQMPGMTMILKSTYMLEETEEGTHITIKGAAPRSDGPIRTAIVTILGRLFLIQSAVESYEKTDEIIMQHVEADREAGRFALPEPEGTEM